MSPRAGRQAVPNLRRDPTRLGVSMRAIIRRLPGLVLAILLVPAFAPAQRPVNEYSVAPGANTQDKGEISTLNFDFKSPRMLEVDMPDGGKKVVWYMCYWVSNFTKDEFTLYPEFMLLTNRNTLHADRDIPSVFEQIRKRADPP